MTVVEDAYNECVPSFVEGNDLAILIVHQLAALSTKGDLVSGFVDIVHLNGFLIKTSCIECTFVLEVGEVGTRKSGCVTSDVFKIHFFGESNFFGVDEQDLVTPIEVRQIYSDLAVKTTWAQERII